MKSQILYKELARYYDLIYSFKDYDAEAKELHALIKKLKKSSGRNLLDVACGTGKHIAPLKKWYICTGVDLNEDMLKVARKNIKGVKFVKADMTKLNLSRKFDIITCLFSSIGYLKTYRDFEKAIVNFYGHLKPGGLVIIGPWFTKEQYKLGTPHMTTFSDKNVKIARLSVSEKKDNISVMDMHYLIAERGKEVTHFIDRHELLMIPKGKFLRAMKQAGFAAKFMPSKMQHGRGLYVGVKK